MTSNTLMISAHDGIAAQTPCEQHAGLMASTRWQAAQTMLTLQVGRPSDVWSLGCILYQMVYGHTPFSALAFIQKMHAITDPNHRIAIPTLRNRALADVIQRCLDRNARTRITMQARCGMVHASDETPQPGMHRACAEVSHMS